MFNINSFYTDAHNALKPDVEGLCNYINSFDNVILWGAGNLGTTLGQKFRELHLKISAYWDVRTADLSEINGVTVTEPFTGGFDSAESLIVFCITNVFISDVVKHQLTDNGFEHILVGEDLYQGLICPFNQDNHLNIKVCRDLPMCNVCTCKKLDNIIKSLNSSASHDSLHFPNITFVINQICSLSCKYCYSYTNNYPPDRRINFPLERIQEDIDRFFDAVDSVTLVPVIGGEPFLHPDISKIVKKFLEKKNFGVLNITTNGICKITAQNLEGFHDDRARVFFSNYLDSLTPQQQELFHRNVDFVKSQGVAAIIYNSTPLWTIPVTLNNKFLPTDMTIQMKTNCLAKESSGKYVKNGRFYPCTIIDSVHNLGIADYVSDYVNLDSTSSGEELRAALQHIMNLPCYRTCSHCGDRGELTAKAGVQGFMNFVNADSSL